MPRHMTPKKPFRKSDLKSVMTEVKSAMALAEPQPELAPAEPTDPSAPITLSLEPNDGVKVQLAHERLQNAQLHLQNRQNELNSLIAQVRVKYEEGGKYLLTSINLDTATIVRVPLNPQPQ